MALLVIGILIFFLPHSVRIVGEGGRDRLIAGIGEGAYKGLYSVLSLVGLVLIGRGYGEARAGAPLLWVAPEGVRHLALLLVPLGLIAVAAAYAPPGRIKRTLRHPMIFGVGLWALAHLLANGTLADLLLFGAFLAWALADYPAALARAPQPVTGPISARGDVTAIAVGLVLSAALIGGLHRWLFGVSPLG